MVVRQRSKSNSSFKQCIIFLCFLIIITSIQYQLIVFKIEPNDTIQNITIPNDTLQNSTILYMYNSEFTTLYRSIFEQCMATPKPTHNFELQPDYHFFDQLQRLQNVQIVSNTADIDHENINTVIFVVPLWNDVFSALLKGDLNNLRKCYKSINNNNRTHHKLINDSVMELRTEIRMFENFVSNINITYYYFTLYHGWTNPILWDFIVKPIYVKKKMYIGHYERNAQEGKNRARLFGYDRIILTPYMVSSYLTPKISVFDEQEINATTLFFSGSIRGQKMGKGAIARLHACKLNQLKNVSIFYPNAKQIYDENLRECVEDHKTQKHFEGINGHHISIYRTQLEKTKFCLFIRGDTFTAARFYYIIDSNCVPIIISDDWFKNGAPFKHIIDYHKMCYFIKEDAFIQDPINEVNEILNDKQWEKKLDYIKKNKNHLIWYKNDSTVTKNVISALLSIIQ